MLSTDFEKRPPLEGFARSYTPGCTPLHSSPFIFPIFLTSLRIFFTLNNCAIWTTKQKFLNVSDCGVHGVIPSLLDSARRFSIFCGDRTFSMQSLSTFSKKDAPSCWTKRAYSLRKFCIVFPLFSVFFFNRRTGFCCYFSMESLLIFELLRHVFSIHC